MPPVVAIDSPLVIPNETGSRPAENALKQHRFAGGHVAVFSSNQRFFERYGGVRGERLLAHWQALDWEASLVPGGACWAFETYPRAVLAELFPAHTKLAYKGSTPLGTKCAGLQSLQRVLAAYIQHRGWQVVGWNPLTAPLPNAHKPADALADALDSLLCVIAAHSVATQPEPLLFGTKWEEGRIAVPSAAPYAV